MCIRDSRSSRYWDSFAPSKKKEEITEGKIHSPVGKFAERAKNRYMSATTWPILTIYKSYNVFSRKDVPLGRVDMHILNSKSYIVHTVYMLS